MKLFYSPGYVAAAHAFATTRKSGQIAASLELRPIPGLEVVAPPSLTEEEIGEVHDPAYVNAVRTGRPRSRAESMGFSWDPGLWTAVCASNGGAVAAAQAALEGSVSGSLSSGLHHARRDHGSGFCTFNGLALAAVNAQQRGTRSILIIDLDAHCGGGTHSILGDNPDVWMLDVATSSFDAYRPNRGRHTLDMIDDAEEYLPTIEQRLQQLHEAGHRFHLCLYNAGMDSDSRCGIGGLRGITPDILRQREQMVFEWCRRHHLPVAFVLAGGYDGGALTEAGVVDLHRLTLEAATPIYRRRGEEIDLDEEDEQILLDCWAELAAEKRAEQG